MKEKIEINQADMLELLVSKINFLTDEYKKLYGTYKVEKGKVVTNVVELTNSYERFLKEKGDIERIIYLYEIFQDKQGKEKK